MIAKVSDPLTVAEADVEEVEKHDQDANQGDYVEKQLSSGFDGVLSF